jgi:hypothetical protein
MARLLRLKYPSGLFYCLFLCCLNDRKYTHMHAEILVTRARIFEMRRMEREAPLDHLFTISALCIEWVMDIYFLNPVNRIADHLLA